MTINKGYNEIINEHNDQYSEWIKRGARWQDVKYNAKGEPYVRYMNRRIPMENFIVAHDGLGYYMETYSSGLILEVHPNGDYAKVSYTYTGRSSKAIKAEEEYRKNRG